MKKKAETKPADSPAVANVDPNVAPNVVSNVVANVVANVVSNVTPLHVEFQHRRSCDLLGDLLARIRDAAENTHSASDDAEAVHQLRVAIRRFQAALTAGKKVIFTTAPYDHELAAVERELKQMMTLAGEVRNRDITLAFILAFVAGASDDQQSIGQKRGAADFVETIERQRAQWRQKLATCVRRSLANGLLGDWCSRLSAPVASSVTLSLEDDLRHSSIKLMRKATDRYFRFGDRANRKHYRSDLVHKFRLAAKRLRYLMEFFQPLWDLRRYSESVRTIQHSLGVINDGETIGELLEDSDIPKSDLRRCKAILKKQQRPHLRQLRKNRLSWDKNDWREMKSALSQDPAPQASQS